MPHVLTADTTHVSAPVPGRVVQQVKSGSSSRRRSPRFLSPGGSQRNHTAARETGATEFELGSAEREVLVGSVF